MVSDTRFETDVKVKLVFGVVLGPGYLLETVGLCVDELCILWNWLVWISEKRKEMERYSKVSEKLQRKEPVLMQKKQTLYLL